MINIAMRSQGAIDHNSLSSVNIVTDGPVQAQTIHSLNTRKERHTHQPSNAVHPAGTDPRPAAGSPQPTHSQSIPAASSQSARPQPAGDGPQPIHSQSTLSPTPRPMPALQHMVQKGQKIALGSSTPLHTLKACLGWNVTNAQCDVDVSAFLLDSTGKVPGDDWFVFYGQTDSPDHSTVFCPENTADRESITIRLDKLNPSVKKIVFVLTIHEALEKKLHFGMVQDAYIRILNGDDQKELVSFKMDEYYSNVISMMIGEIYQHNGNWKFNAIGNGVAKDLSGLCGLYGVQTEG